MSVCTQCGGDRTVKHGHIHNGKQRDLCRDCRRQFVENPQHGPIEASTKRWIDRLLGERIPLAGICRVTGVSETWLQQYVNAKYADTPRQADPGPTEKRGIQCPS